MRSMTGHGRGVVERAGRRATVEIRSVNHRFFDLKLRTGPLEPALEDRVVQAVRRRAERGAFTVAVRDESASGPGKDSVRVDVALARGAFAALEELRRELGLATPVSLEQIAALPGVLVIGESTADPEAVAAAAEQALDELTAMRKREGDILARDLEARLDRLAAFAAEVKRMSADAPAEQGRRLGERLAKLLAGGSQSVDEQRLAQEIAVLADRMDVTEELVRLASHIEQARALIKEDVPVGRKLDFLVQELGREINTIGSKSQAAEIARRVVEAKAELEKIREQVQNVE
jgi:uncharacterized protein (TIGR00255 family)